jgi:hypothetical protein
MKSIRSVRSIKGFGSNKEEKPLFEITAKKRPPRKPRASKFDSYGEDDLMKQIEAMAMQADADFEGRKKDRGGAGARGGVVIEPVIQSAVVRPRIGVIEEGPSESIADEGSQSTGAQSKSGQDNENGGQSSSSSVDEEVAVDPEDVMEKFASGQGEALSQDFLNASSSMVSTIVAASQGEVNEVHVLQYLGMTIVCIAANFIQQGRETFSSRGGGGGPGPGGNPFVTKEVIQSAMFLAFMVNGQRYLAKVTKRGTQKEEW